MSAPNAAIAVESLVAGYGASSGEVLHRVDLDVRPGELCMLIGPNGAGKSTLLRAIAGLVTPQAGRVRLGGEDLAGLDRAEIARRIALVPQSEEPGYGFTVREVVAMGRAPHQGVWQRPSSADADAVSGALAACELEALAPRRVDELSGGERKRVAIARALAQRAPALLLDEAGAHLDVRHVLSLHELVRREVEERKLACVAVVHDLNLAAQYADRVALLVAGRVVAHGPVDEVMTWKRLGDAFGTDLYVGVNELTGARYFVPMRPRSRPRSEGDL